MRKRDMAAITFAGGDLDRAGTLRRDPAQISALLARPDCRVLPVWRGKPLLAGVEGDRLGWLAPGHGALTTDGNGPVLLGRTAQGPRFAVDLSAWEPPDLDPAALAAFHDPTEQHHPDMPADHRFAELRGVMTRLSLADAECAATARAVLGWHRSHRFCSACGAASAMTEAGWRRTCPACGTHHFPRSDPVVIMLVTRGDRMLVGRSPGWPQGMFSLLAGFVEPGETIEAAVRREVAEETGIGIGRVRYVASQPWPFPASLMIGCRAEALDEAITLDPTEVEDARWVGRSRMVAVLDGRDPDMRGARPGSIARHLTEAWLADRLD